MTGVDHVHEENEIMNVSSNNAVGASERAPASEIAASIAFAVSAWLVRAQSRFVGSQKQRDTIRELRRLDDRMLQDIGVNRSDIPGHDAHDLRGVAEILRHLQSDADPLATPWKRNGRRRMS